MEILWILSVFTVLARSESILDIEPELQDVLKLGDISLTETIKETLFDQDRGKYNDVPTTVCSSIEKFRFQQDNTELILKNLQLCSEDNGTFFETQTNLAFASLNFQFLFRKIFLRGTFELIRINSTRGLYGSDIQMIAERVQVSGTSGLNVGSDTLETAALDLKVEPELFRLRTNFDSTTEGRNLMIPELSLYEPLLRRLLQTESYNLVRSIVRRRIDDALQPIPLGRLFQGHLGTMNAYRQRVKNMNTFVNKLVDNLLKELAEFIANAEMNQVGIPDLYRPFSTKWGLITFWGELYAQDGYVRDLATVKRTENFTLTPLDDGMLKIFGGMGLETLQFGYDKYHATLWNIGPSGYVHGQCSRNSIVFSAVGKFDSSQSNIFVDKYDLKITEFENIKIDATGFGFLFNWLFSLILELVAENMKLDVLPQVEDFLKEIIDNLLEDGISIGDVYH